MLMWLGEQSGLVRIYCSSRRRVPHVSGDYHINSIKRNRTPRSVLLADVTRYPLRCPSCGSNTLCANNMLHYHRTQPSQPSRLDPDGTRVTVLQRITVDTAKRYHWTFSRSVVALAMAGCACLG